MQIIRMSVSRRSLRVGGPSLSASGVGPGLKSAAAQHRGGHPRLNGRANAGLLPPFGTPWTLWGVPIFKTPQGTCSDNTDQLEQILVGINEPQGGFGSIRGL